MRGKMRKEGNHELFVTSNGNQILNLKNSGFYALVEGQKGDIIIFSDSDHEKEKTISSGKFYYVDFKNDPEFNDMPHLFLRNGNKFLELVLPEGLPNKSNKRKKLVRTRKPLPETIVLEHVKGRGDKGSLKKYQDKPEGLRSKTKEELYDMAREHNIKGRSKMSKENLVQKLSNKI